MLTDTATSRKQKEKNNAKREVVISNELLNMILIHINTQKLEKNDYVFCRVTAKGKKQFKRNSIYERVKKDVNEPMVPEVKTTTSTNSKTKDNHYLLYQVSSRSILQLQDLPLHHVCLHYLL